MQLDQENDIFDEIIFTYTRAEAIADGVLIDVSEIAKEAGFKVPVAVTFSVWQRYIEWTDEDSHAVQDTEGRLWDVLWMLRYAIQTNKNKSANYMLYQLYIVPRDGKSEEAKLTTLKATFAPGDNGEPVLTIMLPDED